MKRRLHSVPTRLAATIFLATTVWAGGAETAALPMFRVPGFEEDITAINDLHALHHEAAFTSCTLWDAWLRLREIPAWYREVRAEGGYRAYYAKPGRGTLQDGGPAGGLGMDREFMESVLVPQVMLYGFLGFQPRCEYLREMKRYGVLPADFDLEQPAALDPYALDEACWHLFHHRPTRPAGR